MSRGRVVLIGVSVAIWVCLLASFRWYGYNETWELWKVPTQGTRFLDFSLIPGSAESFRRGLEPTVENPGDPGRRLFNYPAFWRLFFYTGITHAHTAWIAPLLIAAFFVAAWSFPDSPTVTEALLLLLVLFSPALMLLYERANVDLVVFVICVMAVLTTGWPGITAVLIVFGAVVKLYPIAGIAVLLDQPVRRFLVLAFCCFLALGLYVVLTWESVRLVWTVTQRPDTIAYGTGVLMTRWQIDGLAGQVPRALAVVLVGASALAAWRRPPIAIASSRNLAAFRMGAAIYVTTFFLGENFNYRLAFLLLTVPQLVAWSRSDDHQARGWSRAALLLVLVSCWQLLETWIVWDEAVNWALLVSLAYLLSASVPSDIIAGHVQSDSSTRTWRSGRLALGRR